MCRHLGINNVIFGGKDWMHQRSNQKSLLEEEQTMQLSAENDKQWSTKWYTEN